MKIKKERKCDFIFIKFEIRQNKNIYLGMYAYAVTVSKMARNCHKPGKRLYGEEGRKDCD